MMFQSRQRSFSEYSTSVNLVGKMPKSLEEERLLMQSRPSIVYGLMSPLIWLAMLTSPRSVTSRCNKRTQFFCVWFFKEILCLLEYIKGKSGYPQKIRKLKRKMYENRLSKEKKNVQTRIVYPMQLTHTGVYTALPPLGVKSPWASCSAIFFQKECMRVHFAQLWGPRE
jgi:hypothetical protein